MVYDSTEGRWENSVPPAVTGECLDDVSPGWSHSSAAFVGVTGFDFPLPSTPAPTCLSHLPAWPSPWRMLDALGNSQLILQLPSSTEPHLPHPFESQQALRSAASTGAKLRWPKGKTQGQKAGDKLSVPHSSASLHPCSWGQESLSGIEVLLQSGVTVHPNCQGTSPSLVSFNRIETRKMERKAPEAGRTHIVGGFISTVLLFFPLWGICTVAWET